MSKKVAVLVAGLAALAAMLSATPAFAYNPFSVCGQSNASAQNSSLCQGQPTDSSHNPLTGSGGLLPNIANILAIVSGIAAVIVIVVGGLKYVTSGGDAAKAKSAKETITFAVVGLIIIAVAAELIGFVISKV